MSDPKRLAYELAIRREAAELDALPNLILGYDWVLNYRDSKGYQLTSKRRKSYKRERVRLYVCQNKKCYWCGVECFIDGGNGGRSKEFTVDHVIPLGFKGTNHWRNLVGSCSKCNTQRERIWRKFSIVAIDGKDVDKMGSPYELIDAVCISNSTDPMNGSKGMFSQRELDALNKDAEETGNVRRWVPAAVATAHANSSDRVWSIMKLVSLITVLLFGGLYLVSFLVGQPLSIRDLAISAVYAIPITFVGTLALVKVFDVIGNRKAKK